jgi:hypothetical protein
MVLDQLSLSPRATGSFDLRLTKVSNGPQYLACTVMHDRAVPYFDGERFSFDYSAKDTISFICFAELKEDLL